MRLIDDAAKNWHRLWSIRVAAFGVVFWSAVFGLWTVWPALIAVVPLWAYAIGGVLMSIALGLARLTKQPGLWQ